jgi:hypothetical protein
MAKRKKSEIKTEKTAKINNIGEIPTETPNEEQNHVENEIPDNSEIIDPLLSAPIVEREYSGKNAFDVHGETPISVEEPEKGKIIVDTDGSSIDEDDEEIPNPEDYDDDNEEGRKQQREQQRKPRQPQYEEPEFEDDGLDPKTKRQMAGNIADTIVDGYKMLLAGGKNFSQRPRDWYQMKAIQGKFDMRVLDFSVDVGGGDMLKYGNFVDRYNEMVDNVMVLDKEKEKRMRTLSKRVCEKHEVGMSDEWTLGLLFGGDIIEKAGLLLQQHRMLSNVETYVTKMFQQQMAQQREETNRQNVVRSKYKTPTEQPKEEAPMEETATPTNIMETKEKGE